jgi:hypothetical protein
MVISLEGSSTCFSERASRLVLGRWYKKLNATSGRLGGRQGNRTHTRRRQPFCTEVCVCRTAWMTLICGDQRRTRLPVGVSLPWVYPV